MNSTRLNEWEKIENLFQIQIYLQMGNCETRETPIEMTDEDFIEQKLKNPLFISHKKQEYVFLRREKSRGKKFYVFYLLSESPAFFANTVGGMAISKGEIQFSNEVYMTAKREGKEGGKNRKVLVPVFIQGYSYHSHWIPFAHKIVRKQFNLVLKERMREQQETIRRKIAGDYI